MAFLIILSQLPMVKLLIVFSFILAFPQFLTQSYAGFASIELLFVFGLEFGAKALVFCDGIEEAGA